MTAIPAGPAGDDRRVAGAGGLLADLYELHMAASYLRRGMVGPATFSLFVRRLPPSRGFLVACGLEDCLDDLETLAFTEDELAYLAELGFSAVDLERFRRLRFNGDVWAVPEGRIVFAGEPLLEVTAPIAEAQLVETLLLNHITFQTTIASKAARCYLAARGCTLVDFSFRRTQGVEAAMAVARASAVAGTMTHSYIEAFADEVDAFVAFAEDFPSPAVFLVDTYDTLEGVRTLIRLLRSGRVRRAAGIRLDSGDLGRLAREARALLDAAGLGEVTVLASGGLDEHAIGALVRQGAPIDAFGVGTRMGVSADEPSLDTAYKLVQMGARPVMKLFPGKGYLAGSEAGIPGRPAGPGGPARRAAAGRGPPPGAGHSRGPAPAAPRNRGHGRGAARGRPGPPASGGRCAGPAAPARGRGHPGAAATAAAHSAGPGAHLSRWGPGPATGPASEVAIGPDQRGGTGANLRS